MYVLLCELLLCHYPVFVGLTGLNNKGCPMASEKDDRGSWSIHESLSFACLASLNTQAILNHLSARGPT